MHEDRFECEDALACPICRDAKLTTTQRDLETANLRCARLEAELEKANNEFGSQTADWPDVWVRIAEVKRIATERYVRLTEAERRLREVQQLSEAWRKFSESSGDEDACEMYGDAADALDAALSSSTPSDGDKDEPVPMYLHTRNSK